MSKPSLYRLAGVALTLGGVLGAIAHMLHPDAPADPAQLAHYAHLSQPIHLMLFSGGVLVLLGLFGQYALQSSAAGSTGLIAFLAMFLGVLFADLLHCILEFSIFPILTASVPYATVALAEATYRSTPLAALQSAGYLLLLAGVPLTAFSIVRSRVLPAWSAIPFAFTTLLLIAAELPAPAHAIGSYFVTALFLSMAVLGFAVTRSTFADPATAIDPHS